MIVYPNGKASIIRQSEIRSICFNQRRNACYQKQRQRKKMKYHNILMIWQWIILITFFPFHNILESFLHFSLSLSTRELGIICRFLRFLSHFLSWSSIMVGNFVGSYTLRLNKLNYTV